MAAAAWRTRAFVVLAGLAAGSADARPFDLPDIPRCTELTPGAVAVDATPVTLNLRIVLDGVPREQGERAAAAAATAYAAQGIGLSVSYDSASFASSEATELMDEARRRYGGARPASVHGASPGRTSAQFA